MNKSFTQNQLRALDISKERNTVVSASAGTGKTTVLVERIFRLLKDKRTSVDRLLVVTFTKLAAAEMKERLKESLSDCLNDVFLAEQAQKLDTADISTLHSFCAEALRGYFYVLGIDPNFSVAEEGVAEELKNEAFDRVAESELALEDDIFAALVEMLGKKSEQTSFKQVVFRLYDFYVCRPDFDAWFEEKKKFYLSGEHENPFFATLDAELKSGACAFEQALETLAHQAHACGAEAAALYAQTLASCVRLPECEGFCAHLKRLAEAELPVFSKKIRSELDAFPDVLFRLEKTTDRLKRFISTQTEKFGGESAETLLARCRDNLVYAEKLAELLKKLDSEFFRLKREKNLLDYNDLEHLTLRLLDNEQAREELCGKYDMIFVDEFQDVNGVQNAIVERLRRRNNLFVVGDIKQSIYGFRQCDPQIFADKTERFLSEGEGDVVYMNDNFRSHAAILDFVNSVFSGVMTRDFGKTDYAATGMFCGEGSECIDGICPVNVDCFALEKKARLKAEGLFGLRDAEQKDGVCHAQARMVAAHIKDVVGKETSSGKKIGYGDVVVLMRSLTDKAQTMCDVLSNCGIPVTVSLKNDALGKEIKDILNFLRALDNPLEDIPFAGALLGWFGGLTAQELAVVAEKTSQSFLAARTEEYCAKYKDDLSDKLARFNALREKYGFLAKCVKADRLIAELAYSTGYDMFVLGLPNGSVRRSRLNRFVKRARISDGMLCDFLKNFDKSGLARESAAGEGGDAVRIMSMHASKGLEFPVVILPCLESDFVLDYPAVSAGTELGIALDCYDFERKEIFPDVAHAANCLVNRRKQTEEELRLLYVALTRAKNHLFILGAGREYLFRNDAFRPCAATNAFSWIMNSLTSACGTLDACGTRVIGAVRLNVVTSENVQPAEQDENCAADGKRLEWAEDFSYPFSDATRLGTKVTASGLDKMNSPVFSSDLSADIFVSTLEDAAGVSRTELGTAYHKLLEKSDFSASDLQTARQTLAKCVSDGLIEERVAKEIDLKKITDCLANPVLKKLVSGGKIFHELPFLAKASFKELGLNDSPEQTILQGVADMLILKENCAAVVDFKFTKRPDLIKDNYALQLKAYGLAVNKILGLPVETYVLSIDDNKLIKIV